MDKVFYRDIKPYHTPRSLMNLKGPSRGVLEVPHSLLWNSMDSVDLDIPGGIPMAYQAILSEGTPDEQESLLNREVLLAYWHDLMLPARVRTLWETRFPALKS
ncbi:MAG: hypothetical protein FWG23_00515 [Eggerthellaceae bacterium]|nr:hypothetical protein [Eggerthellaceae bacterium]